MEKSASGAKEKYIERGGVKEQRTDGRVEVSPGGALRDFGEVSDVQGEKAVGRQTIGHGRRKVIRIPSNEAPAEMATRDNLFYPEETPKSYQPSQETRIEL
ncbi:hypothetical protein PMIN05_002260 [Paraphaeosphaeria minitans]